MAPRSRNRNRCLNPAPLPPPLPLPTDVLLEIMNRLPPKSLLVFRSVSKACRSLIDSPDFISRYTSPHHHLLVTYFDIETYAYDLNTKFLLIADHHPFPYHMASLPPPPSPEPEPYALVYGTSHGLVLMMAPYSATQSLVIWNPAIRISVPVPVHVPDSPVINATVYGFGVCPATHDPKILRLTRCSRIHTIPVVEVFTLSTGVWRSPYLNLPRQSIQFDQMQIVVGGFLYLLAMDKTCSLVVSFDMTSEEFGELNLPDCLACRHYYYFLSFSELRGSLVVLEQLRNNDFGVWMLEDDKSFTKVLSVRVNSEYAASLRGFRKSGEPIIENCGEEIGAVVVEPYSKHFDTRGIDAFGCSFHVYPYVETLLLLDQLGKRRLRRSHDKVCKTKKKTWKW